MNFDDFIKEYGELENYLNLVHIEHGSKLRIQKEIIEIPIPLINNSIKLHETQLVKLIQGSKPNRIPGFNYIDNYGFTYKNYYELFISIQSDDYAWFEGDQWKADPLKFKIADSQFEIGLFSSLMVLLTEPIYRDSDYYYDFNEFASIKMSIPKGADYKDEFTKGIFYLNSYYLKPISFYAQLKSIEFDDGDPLELFSRSDPESVFNVTTRKRNFKRKDFNKCEPLHLYNFATTTKGEQRFLSYYRVLEFFMDQALLMRANSIRYDKSISDEDLVTEIKIRNEQEQLNVLLKTILSTSKRSKLIDYCLHKGFIQVRRFDKICNELYKFRNSIVHAKERELINTRFPNPFEKDDRLMSWIYIVSEIAKECIMKLNSK